MKYQLIIWIAILPFFSFSQSISGTWKYEVLNTPSGDYHGELIIEKSGNFYKGNITSKGEFYDIQFVYAKGDSVYITSNVEGFLATIRGRFTQNKFKAQATVLGDPNIYELSATLKHGEQILQLIDAKSNQPISYATISLGDEVFISNEAGFCKFLLKNQSQITISAIGYKTILYKMESSNKVDIIPLKPTNYTLPLVEIKAKSFSAKKIVEATINRLKNNYIQTPYNANLFFRYSHLNSADSNTYQSESILKFYDSKGYQKRSWKKATSSRYAMLEQSRTTIGKPKKKLQELDQIFVFWSHEPIIVLDKPLSKKSLHAYEFKYIALKEFKGEQVHEIAFKCLNLKSKYTGLSSLKSFMGKLYINQKDYAVLRYELNYTMDYTYKGKYAKKQGHESVRRIIQSSRIEVFSKSEAGYYLDYGKEKDILKTQFFFKNGENKVSIRTIVKEHQFFDIKTKHIEPLEFNLFNLNQEVKYDPIFWQKFNIIMQ